MDINKTLQPGEMGTKRFLNEYGNQLVCMRYRLDKQRQKPMLIALVKIHYDETELRQQA